MQYSIALLFGLLMTGAISAPTPRHHRNHRGGASQRGANNNNGSASSTTATSGAATNCNSAKNAVVSDLATAKTALTAINAAADQTNAATVQLITDVTNSINLADIGVTDISAGNANTTATGNNDVVEGLVSAFSAVGRINSTGNAALATAISQFSTAVSDAETNGNFVTANNCE